MEIPPWVSRALYRIQPDLRLGWHGKERRAGEELNQGSFALIQLLPASVVGNLSEPLIYSELWDVSPRGPLAEMVKVERGPVFSRNGVPGRRDWDPLMQVPIYNVNMSAMGFDNQRVINGHFLPLVETWKESAKRRWKRSMEQAYKDHKSQIDSMAGEATDFLWRQAQQSNATSPIVPWEFAKDEVHKFMEGKRHRKLESVYEF